MNPNFARRLFAVLSIASALLVGPRVAADPAQRGALSIAAAANLVYALDALDAEFAKGSPDVKVTSATGASGNLVAQIRNGAPYDIFLSADLDFPRALIGSGQADSKTLTTFAVGRLVIWTRRSDLDVSDVAAAIRSPLVRKLAIANVTNAPYGRAAKEAMEHLGVWADAQPKLVIGENISQTAQFIETGNADAGFVALSLVLSPKLRDKGRWTEVPEDLYATLDQGAVITAHGANNPAAKAYLEFLKGPSARKIFEAYGYGLPVASAP
jgi:molybdate transport system substrate-binding protein